jgi:thioredoxin 1
MGAVAEVTTATFDQEVLQSDLPVLVDYWAPWCGPCRQVAPSVEAVAEEFAGKAKVFKLDVDKESEIAARYGIMSIPTLIYYKDGKVVDQLLGAQPKKAIADRLQALVG